MHNGYTNWETWTVALEIANYKSAYLYWQDVTEEIADLDELAKRLRVELADQYVHIDVDVINWQEIAKDVMEE